MVFMKTTEGNNPNPFRNSRMEVVSEFELEDQMVNLKLGILIQMINNRIEQERICNKHEADVIDTFG